MKALVKAKAEPGLWLQDVPQPSPGPGEVLIRVLRTGICGTDLHIDSWNEWAQHTIKPGLVVGHEFVGEVVELGEDVTSVYPGEIVGAEGHITCGKCRNCLAGRRALCANTVGIGVHRDGAFAEFIVMPAGNLWPHLTPREGSAETSRRFSDTDLDVFSIFDPFGNAVHVATQYRLVAEDVLVTGAGPIGIMAAMVARHVGARFVVITDVSDYRLELARKVGVTKAVDVRKTRLHEVQQELGMKEGFDVAFEMSGVPSAMREMIDNMAHGGRIAMLGLPDHEFPIDWSQVVFKMLTLRGVYGRQIFETWYQMSVFVQSGLDISPVITHRFPYQQYKEAFAVAHSGQCGKVVLDWSS
ncbi:MAG TPA: L-threonine 3-dehydrogenase [Candidatus Dormibacteraeota bacterium]|jgi:threonine 3-dehydrogenase|nr:L-threonine 3-dehydrogenase [Candidatus Dormibacteraeota bacterium]